jgi:hypothetical protein
MAVERYAAPLQRRRSTQAVVVEMGHDRRAHGQAQRGVDPLEQLLSQRVAPGRPTAERTAAYMECQNRGWIV